MVDNILAPTIGYDSLPGPDSLEIMSETLSLTCISILATAFGFKTNNQRLSRLTYGQFLVLLLYMLSWAFCVTSMVVISTNDGNAVSCTMGILTCDVFYASTKITIYAWLIERAHLATAKRTTRRHSPLYRFNIALLSPYIGIFVLMVIFRNDHLLEDGTCIIGLQYIASIPLLILNLYLTILFVRPLVSANRDSSGDDDARKETRLYKLTRRTVVAAAVCLIVSMINVLILAIGRGYERGVVCLTMCTVDVTINVLTIHWVTTHRIKVSLRTMSAHARSNSHSTPASSPHGEDTYAMDCHHQNIAMHTNVSNPNKTNCSRDDDDSIHSTQVSQSSLIKALH
ncbi:hypothetical protein O0I10_003019 [Lichtheimia ornata]|uniref:Uncharacterized protein n=1 Tax=Lichtheimia ornata TaxID=688661 RepID=A0AAD7V9A0_9FUNG|nr:uncharacterized protein O0I10_003019 [Lichtheimia ornata]KAJ8661270.1 hypothetical protein O0I10_003019 [Lichtheimia ornata]